VIAITPACTTIVTGAGIIAVIISIHKFISMEGEPFSGWLMYLSDGLDIFASSHP
jgi:hypothetical protein